MTSKRGGSLFFILVLVQLCTLTATSLLMYVHEEAYHIMTDILPSLLLSQAVILIPTYLMARNTPAPMRDIFPFRPVTVRTVFLSLLMMVGLFPAIITVNAVSMFFVENVVNAASASILSHPMWIMVLMVGILGPVSEELVFRGFIFQNFETTGRRVGPIVLSALLFGLMHLNFNQAAYAILIGIFLAMAVRAAGSLWPSVIAHAGFNSAEILLMYASRNAQAEEADMGELMSSLTEGVPKGSLVIAAVFLFFVVLGGIVLALRCIREIEREEKGRRLPATGTRPDGKLISIYAVLGMLFSFIFMVWQATLL